MYEYNEQSFRFPLYLWLPVEDIEQGAMQQLRDVASHPAINGHVAVMPDCHQGYGVPIGTVLRTDPDRIIPNAIGVDIGCGVHARKTARPYQEILGGMDEATFWRNVEQKLREFVPVGFARHDQDSGFSDDVGLGTLPKKVYADVLDVARLQMGTLGGGNHFMEYQVDTDGYLWMMVHSGSRALGKAIADIHHRKAIEKNPAGVNGDLSYLSGEDLHWYTGEASIARDYAGMNRLVIADSMAAALSYARNGLLYPNFDVFIDTSHNFFEFRHDGIVHRKGASEAWGENLVAIPGSMGTSSYIVRGRGNDLSYASSSHGAGRLMSRGAAKRAVQSGAASMDTMLAGTFTAPSDGMADEGPHAYKDIASVISRQSDLVAPYAVLKPILTIKGGGRTKRT